MTKNAAKWKREVNLSAESFAKSKCNSYFCICHLHDWLTKFAIYMKTYNRMIVKCRALIAVLVSALPLFYSCGNGGKADGERTEEQQGVLKRLDDSIDAMSPFARKMVGELIKNAQDSISRNEFKVRLGMIYGLQKSDSCPIVTKEALRFALGQKKTPRVNELIAQCYSNMGNYSYIMHKSLEPALRYDMLAYRYMMKTNLDAKICDISANIADIYVQNSDMANGAKWFRRGLFLADSLRLPQSENTTIYLGLAQVYTYMRDYDSALHYYTMVTRHIGDLKPNMRIYLLNNLGNFYFYKGDYGNALLQFRRLKRMLVSSGMGNSLDVMLCRLNLADVFQNLNMVDSSRFYLNGLDSYFKAQHFDAAYYYVNTIKMALALKANDIAAAKHILDTEGKVSTEHSGLTEIRDKYMLDYYEKTGNYKKAFECISATTKRNDSIEKSKSHVRTEEIMMRFQQDTLALHKKINIEEKNRQVKNAYITVVIALSASIIVALVAAIIIVISRKRRVQTEYDMLKLRMANIRNRISPHFIFNVLNHEISGRAKQPEASQLESLTKLIRESLNISDKTFVSLKEELGFVDKYIATEAPLMGTDFTYTCTVSPDIRQDEVKLPSMFVQILVENAIKHGLKAKSGEKRLEVAITQDKGGYTDIKVTDNGTGFDVTRMKGCGTGLNVIRQTINIFNAHNKRKMRFSIINNGDYGAVTGCVAVLRIPMTIDN